MLTSGYYMVRSCQSKIKLNPSAQSKVSGHVLEMLILVKIPNLEFVYFSVANALNYIPLYLYDISVLQYFQVWRGQCKDHPKTCIGSKDLSSFIL